MPQSSPMESNWEVLADGKMNLSQYNAPAAKVTKCILGCIQNSTASQEREELSCSVLVWSHLEHCVQFWVPQYLIRKRTLKNLTRRNSFGHVVLYHVWRLYFLWGMLQLGLD